MSKLIEKVHISYLLDMSDREATNWLIENHSRYVLVENSDLDKQQERIAELEEQLTEPAKRTPFSEWPDGSFPKELENLINKHSIEGGSDTPDFILAEYLMNCLDNFNMCVRRRSEI